MKQRIMVVDDSSFILGWTKDALESAGYSVLTAETVWITHLLDIFHPDLVLMDVEMGAENGAETTRKLKQLQSAARTKIVLYSAKPEEELAKLSQAAEADGFICKGDDPESFTRKVQGILAN